ncbi:MAG: hypothetical protein JAY68_19495 [Candidatus Thiodiazotropha taylori]|nr:hypothetical protein [Candidatus Thiodiazotropha taylori]
MLCEKCKNREALVHLGSSKENENSDSESEFKWERHFCKDCADDYYAQTPGLNASRDLISLSDWYRSKLYDLLEEKHPEAFDYSDTDACQQSGELTRAFLRKQLKMNGIELNDDGFEMLWLDLNCSSHFYKRADEINKKDG